MKTRLCLTTFLTFLVLLTLNLASCGPGEEPSDQDLAFEKLEGDWTFGTSGGIFLEGQDVSLNYAGFSISFSNGTYQTTNSGNLFNASGTWEWIGVNASSISLDNAQPLSFVNLSESELELSFFKTGNIANGIEGNYNIRIFK